MKNNCEYSIGGSDLETLTQVIISALPEKIRGLDSVVLIANEQAFWVNDGRTTSQKAASFIVEKLRQ